MKGKVVEQTPKSMDLQPGTYFWCSCGTSKKQPFCDGSRKGTQFQPRKLEVKEAGRVHICQCKQTDSPNGTCDGTHNSL